MMKRGVLAGLAALALLCITIPSPSQAATGNSWIPVLPQFDNPTFHSVTFRDFLPLQFNYSVLQSSNQNGSFVCKSTSDPQCLSNQLFQFNSILKVCKTQSDVDCIESVAEISNTGSRNAAVFKSYTVTNHLNAYPADTKLAIPAGDMPSLWNIPTAPHASGNEYAVVAGVNGEVNRDGKDSPMGRYIQVSLLPVTLKDYGTGRQTQTGGWEDKKVPGVYYDFCHTGTRGQNQSFSDCGHVNDEDCLLPTDSQGKCYVQEDFKGTPKFNIQLRLSHEPNGWLHGRMTDPNVTISRDSAGQTILSVTAGISTVPMVYQGGLWASLPDNLKKFWVDCFTNMFCGFAKYIGSNPNSSWIDLNKTLEGQAQINSNVYPYSFGKRALQGMAAIAPVIGDKSTASTTLWSFRTLTNDEMNGANKCFTNTSGIKGIVSTNSTTYSAGPPELKDGSLQYQVASAHYLPDGVTPFKGTYNLVMRSDTARCIYGFTSAPIKASISVVSAEGNNDVATTVSNEKDGWLYLSANNFEFSSPTIQVKLTQDSPLPTPSPTSNTKTVAPQNSKPTPIKTTISCVKGKTIKKVTAINPKCPNGYTKK